MARSGLNRRAAADWLTRSPGFVVGLGLVLAYVLLRTLAAPEPLLTVWAGVAAAGTIVSPVLGLTVLAAIGPFTEALSDDGRITAAPILVAALGAGTVASVALKRRVPRPSLPLALALVLLIGTALGVANAARLAGGDAGLEAARLWVPGIGGAMVVLLSSAWVAWRREIRPLLVVMASVALAALISLADLLTEGQIRAGPLGWLLRAGSLQERLGGIIPAPNAAAAIMLVALAVSVFGLLFANRRDFRLLAALALPGLTAAMVLTYSRSALLGLVAIAGLLAWRIRPAAGLAVVLLTLVIALSLAPGFLAVRGQDSVTPPAVGQTTGDELRLRAWSASLRMFLDEPITGHGFRSFERLHRDYGAGRIDAPHNEWLRLFAEEGLFLGLAGVAFALASVAVLMRTPGWIPGGAAAAAAALFVMASFNNPFLYTQVNVPAFLVIGTGLGLALHRREAPVDDDPQPGGSSQPR